MRRMNVALYYLCFGLFLLSCKKDPGPVEPEPQTFAEQKTTSENTIRSYQQLLQTNTPRQARTSLINNLRQMQGIQSAGLSTDSITVWWKTAAGVEICLLTETRASLTDTSALRQAGNQSNSDWILRSTNFLGLPHNKNALVLSPYQWDWNLLEIIPLADETAFISNLLSSAGYNSVFKVNQRKTDQNISMSDYQNFSQYGTVAISSHGGVNSRGDVMIATGVVATEQLYSQYLADLKAGNLVLVVYIDKWFTDTDVLAFAITPGWIRKYYPQKLDSTLFYAGVCKGSFNATMSSAIVGRGAGYFSWTQSVGTDQAAKTGKDLFTQLVSRALNCQQALDAVRANGNGTFSPPLWSTEPQAQFTFVGDSTLRLVERPLAIGVTPAYYDDIGSLLRSFNYQVTTIPLTYLADSTRLAVYDIIGINCAGGLSSYATQSAATLRRFVTNGGRLYTSDWAFIFVPAAFPGYVSFPSNPYIGSSQTVLAIVSDTSLVNYLGTSQVQVTFDLGGWVVIDAVGSSTSVLLTGNVSSASSISPLMHSSMRYAPASGAQKLLEVNRSLAVSFKYGSGRVVYTSFHNHANISAPVGHILEYFTVFR